MKSTISAPQLVFLLEDKELNDVKTKGCHKVNQKGHTLPVLHRVEDPNRSGTVKGETAISESCGREGIASSVYYKWSKAFLGVGKNGLTRAVIWDATTPSSSSAPST